MADAGRRRFALTAGAVLAAWPLARTARAQAARLRESRVLMGTRVDIAAQADDSAQVRAAIDAAFARMAALESVMSHYSATSRVAAINLAAGLQPVVVPPELMQVLQMAQSLSRRSSGAFDVTVGSLGRWHFDPRDPAMPSPAYIRAHLPVVGWRHLLLDERAGTAFLTQRGMRVDLGGIAKLYILQAGLDALRAQGAPTALINGGGDVVAMTHAQAKPWRVGIRDPREPGQLLAAIDVRSGFVASSGDYERFFLRDGRRYHHVIDPRTGYPTQGPHGVTLVGETLDSVNGLGTAAMVLGMQHGRELIGQSREVEALMAGGDGRLWVSRRLRERFIAPGTASA